MVGRISAKGIKNLRLLMSFSNYSQYPVVSRNSAKGINNLFIMILKNNFTKSLHLTKILRNFVRCFKTWIEKSKISS